MKIVIAGGNTKAEYIIRSFKDRHNELVVINPNIEVVERLRKSVFIKVYHGEPWSRIALEQCNAFDADVFISLCERDTDNYATCLMAKRMFNAKKTICVVDNPLNVDYFKKLGLDSVISSTYLLGQTIMSESSVETLTKTLSLDDNRITVVEKVLLTKYAICHRPIKEIRFPKYASIAAISRDHQIIIPSGDVVLQPKDVLIMVTAPHNQKALLRYVEAEASPAARSTPKPAAQPAPKSAAQPAPKPEEKPAKPAEKPAVSEPKPAKKPEPKPEPKPKKQEAKKPESKPAKPAKKPEPTKGKKAPAKTSARKK